MAKRREPTTEELRRVQRERTTDEHEAIDTSVTPDEEDQHRRRDSSISREGSVTLRRALIDLGIGLWHGDPAAKRYGQQLRARGKHGGVISCAMAHRANKIAFALVRDQVGYDPARWA